MTLCYDSKGACLASFAINFWESSNNLLIFQTSHRTKTSFVSVECLIILKDEENLKEDGETTPLEVARVSSNKHADLRTCSDHPLIVLYNPKKVEYSSRRKRRQIQNKHTP